MISKVLKRVLLASVICGTIASTSEITVVNVQADTINTDQSSLAGTVVDGSRLLDPDVQYAEAFGYPLARWDYLNYGTSQINVKGNGAISALVATYAHQVSTEVTANALLQRLVNGSWMNYMDWDNSLYNTHTIIVTKQITIPKGYYYRLKGGHYVTCNGKTDSTGTTTDGVLVN